VTDAITAAGSGPGSYTFGSLDVQVHDGAVRGPDGVLAGSVLTGFGQLAHAGKLRLAFRRRRSPKDATNFHRFRELTSQRDVK